MVQRIGRSGGVGARPGRPADRDRPRAAHAWTFGRQLLRRNPHVRLAARRHLGALRLPVARQSGPAAGGHGRDRPHPAGHAAGAGLGSEEPAPAEVVRGRADRLLAVESPDPIRGPQGPGVHGHAAPDERIVLRLYPVRGPPGVDLGAPEGRRPQVCRCGDRTGCDAFGAGSARNSIDGNSETCLFVVHLAHGRQDVRGLLGQAGTGGLDLRSAGLPRPNDIRPLQRFFRYMVHDQTGMGATGRERGSRQDPCGRFRLHVFRYQILGEPVARGAGRRGRRCGARGAEVRHHHRPRRRHPAAGSSCIPRRRARPRRRGGQHG